MDEVDRKTCVEKNMAKRKVIYIYIYFFRWLVILLTLHLLYLDKTGNCLKLPSFSSFSSAKIILCFTM